MTDHLPECPLLEPCDDDVPEHGYCSMQRGAFCIHCHQWCICDRLRACEQRVRDEERDDAQRILIKHGAQQFVIGERMGRTFGYTAGVQAAREAVAALPMMKIAGNFPLYDADDVLAAIDALTANADTERNVGDD